MASFFSSIWDIVTSIIEFFKSFIEGLFTFFKLLPGLIAQAITAIGFLPSLVIVFATLTITISVIMIIVGRESGG